MKITSNLTSLILKLAGGMLLILGILDYLFSVIPSQWEDLNWQINLINGFIDKGIVPLVAICLLFLSWWIEDSKNVRQKSSPNLRIAVLVISCLFGLSFLLLIPWHLSNVSQISNQLTDTLDQQVAQQEAQLQNVITQLEAVSQDPERLKQEVEQRKQVLQAGGVIQGQQIPPQQLEILRQETEQLQELLDLSENPQQLQARLDELKNSRQSELKDREDEERKKAQTLALQQSLQTSIRSLILTIVYSAIGWFGLKGMMTSVS